MTTKTSLSPSEKERGQSLVEAVMAVAMIAGVTLTIYQLVYSSKHSSKQSDFYGQCINAVRSKLNEYKYGIQTDLTTGTMSLTNDTVNGSRGGYTAANNGFAYAKMRYNTDRYYCPYTVGPSGSYDPMTVSLNPTPAPFGQLKLLGREECIVTPPSGVIPALPPTWWMTPIDCVTNASVPDKNMAKATNGRFRLFVNLRRYNATINGVISATNPPIEDCILNTNTSNYDFQQAGDMIKVTVTGVIDLQAGESFDNIQQGTERQRTLSCQISDFIKPHTHLARYWMQTDGNIYRWIGTGTDPGASGTGQSYQVFSSLSSPGNLGFSISPDNKYALVLMPGKLLLYSGCGGDPVDCPVTTNPPTEYDIDPRIVSISAAWTGTGANFCAIPTPGVPVVFGLLSDHLTGVCIDLSGTNQNSQLTGVPFQINYPSLAQATQASRINSIFMDATGTSTYFVDLTCSDSIKTLLGGNATTSYCGGIYHSNDIEMRYPVEAFSLRAIAFSK